MADRSGPQARRTETNRTRQTRSNSLIYGEYETGAVWRVLEKGIDDLVKNHDLKEQTPRRYIVGYLCKLLAQHDLL